VSSKNILIVGGYGVVRTRIAAQLATEYPGCLVIGGRNPERADELAKSIGNGVRGRKIDIYRTGYNRFGARPHWGCDQLYRSA
jgi:glutamyl-tRNA reductase